MQTKYKKFKTV